MVEKGVVGGWGKNLVPGKLRFAPTGGMQLRRRVLGKGEGGGASMTEGDLSNGLKKGSASRSEG